MLSQSGLKIVQLLYILHNKFRPRTAFPPAICTGNRDVANFQLNGRQLTWNVE